MLKFHKINLEEDLMNTTIQTVKGTRDFYPDLMQIRNWLYKNIKTISELYGYQEYEGPFLERIDLYAAKSGEELVKEQAFVFSDRGGDLVTLRPELTPTLARMIAQKQKQFVYPLRWWSYGPFWRYERPQRGRTREFFQWNIDLIGENCSEADAEIIAICAAFFEAVGLTEKEVRIHVNDRKLMENVLAEIDTPKDKMHSVFQLIDRREKMTMDVWQSNAREIGLDEKQVSQLLNILENKDLWKESENLDRIFGSLEFSGFSKYVIYDANIIRGLDYYTGTVFEARDHGESGRALLGGGHYDNLVSDVGGDPLPGVGFAMGDVMMTHVLEKYNKLPEQFNSPAEVLVTVFDENLYNKSSEISRNLRKKGIKVVSYSKPARIPKQLKYADRLGIRYVVIIGPDEVQNEEITLKDLAERQQYTIKQSDLANRLLEMLDKASSV